MPLIKKSLKKLLFSAIFSFNLERKLVIFKFQGFLFCQFFLIPEKAPILYRMHNERSCFKKHVKKKFRKGICFIKKFEQRGKEELRKTFRHVSSGQRSWTTFETKSGEVIDSFRILHRLLIKGLSEKNRTKTCQRVLSINHLMLHHFAAHCWIAECPRENAEYVCLLLIDLKPSTVEHSNRNDKLNEIQPPINWYRDFLSERKIFTSNGLQASILASINQRVP